MAAVRRVVLLLLLGAAGATAENHGCEALNQHLPAAQLDKVFGDWVLVWSVADSNLELLGQISSSHVELKLMQDNRTIAYTERNIGLSNTSSCTTYFMNVTVRANSENLTLQSQDIRKEQDGVVQHYNESGEVDVYQSCEDCLMIVYRASESGRYLLSYKREGSHQDVDLLKAAHDQLKKQAECLNFSTDKPYVYDGVSDFCHKKSAAVQPEES